MSKWMETLSVTDREYVSAEMKRIQGVWREQDAIYEQLRPPIGTVRVGAQYMDAFANAECTWEFLSALGRGENPETACESAKRRGVKIWKDWNSQNSRDIWVCRDRNATSTFIDLLAADLVKFSQRINERTRPTPETYLEYRPEGCGHDAETMPF